MSGTDVYYYLQHGKRLERPSRCPSSTYQLMLRCWDWDEKRRPTFSQLLQLFKTDPEYRSSNKTVSMLTMPRTKSLKATSSSSTLTDENNQNLDDGNSAGNAGNDDDDEVSEPSNEQYVKQSNGHVSKTRAPMRPTVTKDRTNI